MASRWLLKSRISGETTVWIDDGGAGPGLLRRLPSGAALTAGLTQGLPAAPAPQQPRPRAAASRKRKSIYDTVTDTQMVEQVFGFLPSMIGGQEGQAPARFEVRRPVLPGGPGPECRPVGLWLTNRHPRGGVARAGACLVLGGRAEKGDGLTLRGKQLPLRASLARAFRRLRGRPAARAVLCSWPALRLGPGAGGGSVSEAVCGTGARTWPRHPHACLPPPAPRTRARGRHTPPRARGGGAVSGAAAPASRASAPACPRHTGAV